MLANHGTALEADLQRFYQVDLADLYRGLITPRKVAVLATNLPRASAVGRSMGGPDAISDEVESLWLLEHTTASIAHAKGGSKGKAPQMREYPLSAAEVKVKKQKTESRAERWVREHGK